MKKDAENYIARHLECQRVKAIHQHLARILQHIPILEWKWETITMDFATGIPITKIQNDSIMVVIDKMTKATRLIQSNPLTRKLTLLKYPGCMVEQRY